MDRSLASDFFLGSVCRQAPPSPPSPPSPPLPSSFQDLADPAKALPPHLPQWVPKEECISPFPQFKSPSPKLPRTVGGSSFPSQSRSFPRLHGRISSSCCPVVLYNTRAAVSARSLSFNQGGRRAFPIVNHSCQPCPCSASMQQLPPATGNLLSRPSPTPLGYPGNLSCPCGRGGGGGCGTSRLPRPSQQYQYCSSLLTSALTSFLVLKPFPHTAANLVSDSADQWNGKLSLRQTSIGV